MGPLSKEKLPIAHGHFSFLNLDLRTLHNKKHILGKNGKCQWHVSIRASGCPSTYPDLETIDEDLSA